MTCVEDKHLKKPNEPQFAAMQLQNNEIALIQLPRF